ncbi:MAG: hypothetical protein QOH26_1291, partial [Actinomycetota bacterium]|nr:hypothetical protein [Actinomycetota bacterium]
RPQSARRCARGRSPVGTETVMLVPWGAVGAPAPRRVRDGASWSPIFLTQGACDLPPFRLDDLPFSAVVGHERRRNAQRDAPGRWGRAALGVGRSCPELQELSLGRGTGVEHEPDPIPLFRSYFPLRGGLTQFPGSRYPRVALGRSQPGRQPHGQAARSSARSQRGGRGPAMVGEAASVRGVLARSRTTAPRRCPGRRG